MITLGTIINCMAVLLGGGLGMALKEGLPAKVSDLLMQALGLCTIFIGISGALSVMLQIQDQTLVTQGTMLLIASLGIGAVIGEWIDIESKMEAFAEKIKRMFHAKDSRFVEGFVSNSLIICVGAMAVVGALQDGLMQDPSMLITKAILDGIISMVFASALGVGVLFAAIPLGLYQGSITLLASIIAPLFSPSLIANLSFVGSVLIFGVGINLLFGKKIKIGNVLPALLVPMIYEGILMLHIID